MLRASLYLFLHGNVRIGRYGIRLLYYWALSHVKSSYRCPSDSPRDPTLNVKRMLPRLPSNKWLCVCTLLVYLPIIPAELIDRTIISPSYRQRNRYREPVFSYLIIFSLLDVTRCVGAKNKRSSVLCMHFTYSEYMREIATFLDDISG